MPVHYGMEGPGGYQWVGRTVPVWNRYYRTADFTQPWLLRFFDQIRFFPVTGAELQRYREDVIYGRVKLDIHAGLQPYPTVLQKTCRNRTFQPRNPCGDSGCWREQRIRVCSHLQRVNDIIMTNDIINMQNIAGMP